LNRIQDLRQVSRWDEPQKNRNVNKEGQKINQKNYKNFSLMKKFATFKKNL
jgi:hypothetical protein